MRKKFKGILALGAVISTVTCNFSNAYAYYDSDKAVVYAKKYVHNANSDYHYFSGADCTNFVSQCIREGGIDMKNTPSSVGNSQKVYFNRTDWYHASNTSGKYYKVTTSWCRVSDFATYSDKQSNSKVTVVEGLTERQLACMVMEGDVVQTGTYENGYSHSVICIEKKNSNSENIKFGSHTSDYVDKNLSALTSSVSDNRNVPVQCVRYRLIHYK